MPQGRDAAAPAYRIESVDNALLLLRAMRHRQRIRVSEAAELLGVARSTAHRLLQMLQFHGFVEQEENGRAYAPGSALIEIGLAAVGSLEIRRKARPHLERLSAEFDETVHLTVLEGNGVRFIDGVEGTKTLRVGTRTGMLLPAHVTAGGKALLAELPEEDICALYPRGMAGSTEQSITDLQDLLADLRLTSQRGYSLNHGESEPGVVAVAACVRHSGGFPLGAMAVAAPETRMPSDRIAVVASRLLKAAQAVSESLGRPNSSGLRNLSSDRSASQSAL